MRWVPHTTQFILSRLLADFSNIDCFGRIAIGELIHTTGRGSQVLVLAAEGVAHDGHCVDPPLPSPLQDILVVLLCWIQDKPAE